MTTIAGASYSRRNANTFASGYSDPMPLGTGEGFKGPQMSPIAAAHRVEQRVKLVQRAGHVGRLVAPRLGIQIEGKVVDSPFTDGYPLLVGRGGESFDSGKQQRAHASDDRVFAGLQVALI